MSLTTDLAPRGATFVHPVAYDVRRAASRGRMQLSWLDARFSFSFGPYRDPDRNGFGSLLALNEDVIQPGTGFEPHPHQDLEIFILPLAGAVEHRDSLGNRALVRPGDVQKMRAGGGIWHSQMNASPTELDHHLQIWLRPRTPGLRPGIDQRTFVRSERQGQWQLLVSETGENGSLAVDQDARLLRAELGHGVRLSYQPRFGKSLYLHLIQGSGVLACGTGHEQLGAGDGVAIPSALPIELQGLGSGADVLLFELAGV